MRGSRYAFILAGGEGRRLCILSERRAKPAVPFGGKYRIIDFTLSNCVNSGIYDIGVLTQYRPTSLHRHVGTGRPWDLDRSHGGVQILQPSLGTVDSDWYQGTADAIYQNLLHLRRRRIEHVLVLSGDHIYTMDYNVLYAVHVKNRARVTVAVTEVPPELTNQFGILQTDAAGRVVGFEEKPRHTRHRTASMGVYLFDRDSLIEWLLEDAARPESRHDFGKDLLPVLVSRQEAVYAHRFTNYWQDVGTVDSFYEASLSFLSDRPPIDLANPDWTIHTQSADRPPVRFEHGSQVVNSQVANGCSIAGEVVRSVLFPGVTIAKGAVVRDSIVMNDTVVQRGAVLDRAIVDKEAEIGEGARIGWGDDVVPNAACPEHLSSGLTVVGKGAHVPDGIGIGRNARIGAYVTRSYFTADVPSGGVVDGPESMH